MLFIYASYLPVLQASSLQVHGYNYINGVIGYFVHRHLWYDTLMASSKIVTSEPFQRMLQGSGKKHNV
jgi:hypothetical protein